LFAGAVISMTSSLCRRRFSRQLKSHTPQGYGGTVHAIERLRQNSIGRCLADAAQGPDKKIRHVPGGFCVHRIMTVLRNVLLPDQIFKRLCRYFRAKDF